MTIGGVSSQALSGWGWGRPPRAPIVPRMDFAFTDEQEHYAGELARWARNRLAPEYARWDRGEPFPKEERLREMAELGLTGLRVPEEYGGAPASYVTLGIAAEELGRADF